MTDKIIIDGVDVSGCEYKTTTRFNPVTLICDNTELRCRGGNDGFCKDHPNCCFKQSARKDERIKELEGKLSDAIKLAKQNADSNEYCLQELEKENGNLKQKLAAKNSLLNDSQKVIERLAIKLQSPLKVKPTDPTEPLYRKLSQIAELAEKADCVISHCVYHEMTNETEILKELYRFGKSGELNRIKLVNESVFELDTILQQIKQIAGDK